MLFQVNNNYSTLVIQTTWNIYYGHDITVKYEELKEKNWGSNSLDLNKEIALFQHWLESTQP